MLGPSRAYSLAWKAEAVVPAWETRSPVVGSYRCAQRCAAVASVGKDANPPYGRECMMIVLGIALIIAGFLLAMPILTTLGVVLFVVGVILMVLGSMGRAVGGRRHYY